MSRWIRGIGGIGIAAILAGCGEVSPVPADVATTGMPNTDLALQRSMGEVDAALAELNRLPVKPNGPPPPVVSGELDRPVTLAWTGPLDDGVKTLADRVGYRLSVNGPPPANPIAVSVNLTDATALAAFQAFGAAAGSAATIVVDQQHQLVEVDYHA